MRDVLKEICDRKREHIAAQKKKISEPELHARIKARTAPRPFAKALKEKSQNKQTALIAEIKKASPSRGLIRADFDLTALAHAYEQGGATCLSVLTDEPYFQGKDDYIGAAHAACALPILRKDFMLDPYQIIESRALGADCILLIMAALSDDQAIELETAAREFDMGVLIEVHDAAEFDRAVKNLKSPLLGINNRNLKTLAVDLATTETLAPRAPSDKIIVCESGIGSPADIARMKRIGVHCFLVGESLMLQPDVTTATRTLLSP